MSRAKTLLESLWIISIIIPPKVRVRRKAKYHPSVPWVSTPSTSSQQDSSMVGKVPRWKNGPRWLRVYGSARERDGKTWATIFGGSVSRFGSICLGTYETKWEICWNYGASKVNSKIKILYIFLSLTSHLDCWNVVVGPLTQFRQFQSWKTIRESSRIQVNMKSRPAWFSFHGPFSSF